MADIRLLALTHLLAAGAGFVVAPREMLESEVAHNGFFQTDTKRVLAAAVESLRAENKLLIYSYKGFAAVTVHRDGFLFLDGRQDLIVPAAVSYFVDLSTLRAEHVSIIDELAFSPLIIPLDGLRHGMDGFVFPFDYLEDHSGWFELFVTLGNDGFAFFLFVRDREGVDPELLSMCRAHAGR